MKINVATSAENANLQKVDLNKLDEPNESVVVEEKKSFYTMKKMFQKKNVITKTVKKSNKKTKLTQNLMI